jgi:hypothetical protein
MDGINWLPWGGPLRRQRHLPHMLPSDDFEQAIQNVPLERRRPT